MTVKNKSELVKQIEAYGLKGKLADLAHKEQARRPFRHLPKQFSKGILNYLSNLYKSIKVLGFFIFLQIVLGIFTLLYGAQIYIASMHQISSIFLVASCIYFLFINTKSNLQLSS